jgi:hypothetical protein
MAFLTGFNPRTTVLRRPIQASADKTIAWSAAGVAFGDAISVVS